MNKLNVDDYVRVEVNDYTRHTIIISKVKLSKVKYSSNDIVAIEDSELLVHKKDIINSSPDIIDLIEVGDYVNGKQVIDFMLENGKRKGIIVDADIWGFDIDEIKSIVTKEQFEAMKYEIK